MHAKIWKCKFRYSGVRKMYEVWGGGGGPYHWGGGVGIRDPDSYIYVCNLQKGSNSLLFFQMVSVSAIGLVRFFLRVKSKQGRNVQ